MSTLFCTTRLGSRIGTFNTIRIRNANFDILFKLARDSQCIFLWPKNPILAFPTPHAFSAYNIFTTSLELLDLDRIKMPMAVISLEIRAIY